MIASIRNSVSGVKAGMKALGVSAFNIAGARSSVPLDEAAVTGVSAGDRSGGYDESPRERLYRPVRAKNVATAGGGVRAVTRQVDPPYLEAFAPGNPVADESGRVARANVDLAEEIVHGLQARTLYDANLRALRAEDETLGMLLDDRA